MEPLRLYEIVNPSDAYTMECADELVASVAILLLGDGTYGLKPVDGPELDNPPPLLFFDERALQEWCLRVGIGDVDNLSTWALDHGEAVADALDSVVIGSVSQRRTFERMLAAISSDADRTAARSAYHDELRSSMNDIGRTARGLATGLRARLVKRDGQRDAAP